MKTDGFGDAWKPNLRQEGRQEERRTPDRAGLAAPPSWEASGRNPAGLTPPASRPASAEEKVTGAFSDASSDTAGTKLWVSLFVPPELCAWQWNKKFVSIDKKGHQTVRVKAKAGWQPGSVRVKKGVVYEYATKGQWHLDGTGESDSADGNEGGDGRLTAVVMNNYELSEPIPLGKRGRFTSPGDGNLYLRCGEAWTRLGDNSGTITVYLRLGRAKPSTSGSPAAGR